MIPVRKPTLYYVIDWTRNDVHLVAFWRITQKSSSNCYVRRSILIKLEKSQDTIRMFSVFISFKYSNTYYVDMFKILKYTYVHWLIFILKKSAWLDSKQENSVFKKKSHNVRETVINLECATWRRIDFEPTE